MSSSARIGLPGSDVADEGNVAHGGSLDGDRTVLMDDFDGTRLGRIPTDEALVRQGVEMGVHGGRRAEADGVADLAN